MTLNKPLSDLLLAKRNLNKVSYNSILKLINRFQLSHVLCVWIPKNTMIFRARPNENDEEFTSVDQISYLKEPVKFGRAHRPGSPMFYGSIASPEKEDGFDCIATIIAESMAIFRNKFPVESEKKLTIGRWSTNDDLCVIGMIFNKTFLENNIYFRDLKNDYLTFLDQHRNNPFQIEFLNFISDEFMKTSIDSDNDYKLSAAFVEAMLKGKYELDGIIYPSARTEGKYLDIALTPKCVNNSRISLKNVATTRLYYKNGYITLDYEKEAFLKPGETEFCLTEILDKSEHIGKENALKQLEKEISKNIKI